MAEMALALTLDAARQLADPNAAFEDAREWARSVGIVSDVAHGAETFARDHRIRQDYFPGSRDIVDSLAYVESQYLVDRHVLVGDGEADRAAADAAGWEYLTVEEAAEKAGWELQSDDSEAGLLDRVRGMFESG